MFGQHSLQCLNIQENVGSFREMQAAFMGANPMPPWRLQSTEKCSKSASLACLLPQCMSPSPQQDGPSGRPYAMPSQPAKSAPTVAAADGAAPFGRSGCSAALGVTASKPNIVHEEGVSWCTRASSWTCFLDCAKSCWLAAGGNGIGTQAGGGGAQVLRGAQVPSPPLLKLRGELQTREQTAAE